MKILFVVGHNSKSGGASAASGYFFKNEYEFNSKLAEDLSCYLSILGYECIILKKNNMTRSQVIEYSNFVGFDLHVELHANSYKKMATGSETLFINTNESKKFALYLQISLISYLGLRDRGVKELVQGSRGYKNLLGLKAPSVITEPFFINNPKDCDHIMQNYDKLVKGISEGIIKWSIT